MWITLFDWYPHIIYTVLITSYHKYMEIEYIDLKTREDRLGEGKYTWLWSLPLYAVAGILLALVYLS